MSFSAGDVSEIIIQCDHAGYAVYEQEIGRFLDQTVKYTPVYDEWRRLPLDVVMPGECILIKGTRDDGGKSEFEVLKLTPGRYLALEKDVRRQDSPRPLGIVEIHDDCQLEVNSKLETSCFSITPDMIRIEFPSLYHRAIDRLALNMEYVSRGPGNILRLYNALCDRHSRHEIENDTEGTMDLVAGYGISTFVLRKLLDYITLSHEY